MVAVCSQRDTGLLNLALNDDTAAFLVLRLMPPRTWWQLRSLSREWKQLLDDSEHNEAVLARCGLRQCLVEGLGPLRTANSEVDFAGCVYKAVHHGSIAAVQQLMRPLAVDSFARRLFAVAVAREALVQAAVAGDLASVSVVLKQHGPDSPAAATKRNLCKEDALLALKAAADWHQMSPEDVPDFRRQEVNEMLRTTCC